MTSRQLAFHVMLKPHGAICNLDCQYCFYLRKEKLYPGATFRMSEAVLESFTRQYIVAQQAPEVTFAWQGGEPTLMGLDFYRKAVDFQRTYRKPGMKIHNSFQTNAMLLDEEWCQFFRQNQFLIGVSLDGTRELHDAYRVDKGGQPTFTKVMQGLDLLKQHHVAFNILACVNDQTVQRPGEVYRFFRDEVGAQFIQFIPVVECIQQTSSPLLEPNSLVSTRSVSGPDFGNFLISIFDEWVRNDVGKVYIQIFDVALAAWAGYRPGLCVHEETCGLALAMEHNGDVYTCDHFVEKRYMIGNLMDQPLIELISSSQQRRFGLDKKASLPGICRRCPVRFVCNGGCPKDRLLTAPGGASGLNYLCEGYKDFFTYIDRPMKFMADLLHAGRPPADIMEKLKEKQYFSTPGRRRRRT